MELYLRRLSKVLMVSAVLWSVWVGYQIWTTPLTSHGMEITETADHEFVKKEFTRTKMFSEISDLGILPLLIPVMFILIAAWSVFKGNITGLVIATALFSLFWIISGFSIGVAYTKILYLLVCVLALNVVAKLLTKVKNP